MLDITGAGAQLPMRSHWKLRPGPQSHKNSEQQCKRDRANTASNNTSATGKPQQTAKQALQGKRPSNRNLPPVPSQAHTLALCRPECHVRCRCRATYEETSEGARTAAGCKADPTSTTSLPAPPLASVPHLVANRPCGSRANLRIVLRGEEGIRPA